VSEFAAANNLPVRPAADINEPSVVEAIRQLRPELIFVVDFGQKIGPEVCQAAPHGAVNLHGSLLPELRGAAPINWAIIRGYRETGVTTFRIVEKMDAGTMFLQRSTAITPDETADDLRHRLADLGCQTVLETLGLFAAGWSAGVEQDHSKATKAPKLKKHDGVIAWSADAVTIRNLIHGTWPWPGGQGEFVSAAGKVVPVLIARVAVLEQDACSPPGTIEHDHTVATGKGRLAIRQIKPSGGRLMNWQDFINGYRATPGSLFRSVQS
jgi:methionyl-tRNA formyltransferase